MRTNRTSVCGPQDTEGTMGGARTSTFAQANLSNGSSLSDSTSASGGSKTTANKPPPLLSCPQILGESHHRIVPRDTRIPRYLEDTDEAMEELKTEFDKHTLDTHTPKPSQYIRVHKIPQRRFAQIQTDLDLLLGVRMASGTRRVRCGIKNNAGRAV
ncbi:hypothetical protein N7501_011602 [Penicillium viridicatum]|nr:hypothetical protein N7501_011602 [Penicillium viridicatum]